MKYKEFFASLLGTLFHMLKPYFLMPQNFFIVENFKDVQK